MGIFPVIGTVIFLWGYIVEPNILFGGFLEIRDSLTRSCRRVVRKRMAKKTMGTVPA